MSMLGLEVIDRECQQMGPGLGALWRDRLGEVHSTGAAATMWKEMLMVKPIKYLQKQASKAEAAARRVSDREISGRFLAMARGYRSQAEILKAKRQQEKSKSRS